MSSALYILVALGTWAALFVIINDPREPIEDADGLLAIVVCGLLAAIWPVLITFSLWCLLYEHTRSNYGRSEGGGPSEVQEKR